MIYYGVFFHFLYEWQAFAVYRYLVYISNKYGDPRKLEENKHVLRNIASDLGINSKKKERWFNMRHIIQSRTRSIINSNCSVVICRWWCLSWSWSAVQGKHAPLLMLFIMNRYQTIFNFRRYRSPPSMNSWSQEEDKGIKVSKFSRA